MLQVLFARDSGQVFSCMQGHESYIELQLAETTTQLHFLEEQKQLLEARNALLEKISYLNAKVSALPQADEVRRHHASKLCS